MSKVNKILLIIIACLALVFEFCVPGRLFQAPRSAVLEASDGTLLGAHISAGGQWYFPPSGEVPDKFERCIVAYEDGRFRLHHGVDWLAVARAAWQNVTRGKVVSGASTITMQTIRMSRPGAPRTLPEKVWEAILAHNLELRCSKDKILRLYASNAPFGGNVVGIDAAAWRYFGRDAGDLSWAECATLAVLPNSPALIHPGRNREQLRAKRDFLLDKLLAEGALDSLECALAKDEPLPDRPHPMPDGAYHLLERFRTEGDGICRSTLDGRLQERVSRVAESHFAQYHTNLVDNMAVLVVDVHTGKVVAWYGNTRGCSPSLRGVDVDMVPAARSSGSTLKPLLYAAMIQDGAILPSSLVKDIPYNRNNFAPHNFSRTYDGAVPAHEVIERSLNVPSVRMLEQYGVDEFLEVLRRMGFDTITEDADHYGLSLILGGAEISLYTLVRAYYQMAAKLSGEPVREDLSYRADENVRRLHPDDVPLSRAAIWLTFDALSNANRPEEEASWLDFSSGRKTAWKTGTSWGDRDAWSVGVTADYVVGVWVGNSDGEGRAGMTGVAYAAPVMFDVFAALPAGKWFQQPYGEMTLMEVCHDSGFPASDICPRRDTVWVPDMEARPDPCPYHRLVHLDAAGRYQVNSACCPVDEIRTESWFVLPPAQEWYYRQRHLDYKCLPPRHPDFDSSAGQVCPIEIIYPQYGITVVVTTGLDGSRKGAVFRAAHSDRNAVLYWHLDDEYLGQTVGDHEMMVLPEPGQHVLTLVDGNGARRSVLFYGK